MTASAPWHRPIAPAPPGTSSRVEGVGLLVAVINLDGAGPSNAEMLVSIMMYVFAVLAIIGGLSSLTRTSYPMSVFGAACSIFGPGFFFGIPALVLTAKSSEAFEKG